MKQVGGVGGTGYEDDAFMPRPSPRQSAFTPKGGITPRGDNEGNKTPKSLK